mmetsp:Transcript_3649/g.8608  ORF Transcript_3649/g.8608 Transcript_3649/m.8608 type:complete len:285 (+) Transcript_3649:59-913(+)
MQGDEQLDCWSNDLPDLTDIKFQGAADCFNHAVPMARDGCSDFDQTMVTLPQFCLEDLLSPPMPKPQPRLDDSLLSTPLHPEHLEDSLGSPDYGTSPAEGDDDESPSEVATPTVEPPVISPVKRKGKRAAKPTIKIKPEIDSEVRVGTKRHKPDSDDTEQVKPSEPKARGPIIRPQYKCGKCGQMKKGHACPTVKEEQVNTRVFQMALVLAAQNWQFTLALGNPNATGNTIIGMPAVNTAMAGPNNTMAPQSYMVPYMAAPAPSPYGPPPAYGPPNPGLAQLRL